MQEYSARGRHELRPFNARRATLPLKAVGFDCNLLGQDVLLSAMDLGFREACAPDKSNLSIS